ncbi:MAG: CsgG/HfaB family protein, partial [Campylobacterota bacterium]|nr:CsgG/HfaB family protein [Campylobacterota bacterium]
KQMLKISLILMMSLVVGLFAEENVIKEPPKGNLRYSIMVEDFKNEANWSGRHRLGNGMTTAMTNILNKSGWFVVLGDKKMRAAAMREQDFSASGRTAGGKKSAKMGRMTPAQLLVRGSITHVQETSSKKGKLNFMGVSLGGSGGNAEINITVYLVDTTTGQVVASKDIIGNSGKKGYSLGYSGSELGGLTGGFGGKEKDNIQKAMENATGQITNYLIAQLENIPWEATVMMAKRSKIIINRGERDGIAVGKVFNVGEIEELIDPDTGELLDSEMTIVGTIKVTKVKQKIAYCKALSGAGELSKGMSVFPQDR